MYIASRLIAEVAGSIVTVSNGLEALSMVQDYADGQRLPQLILSDMDMPLMDGLSFVQKLKKLSEGTLDTFKVVLLSERFDDYELTRWAVEHPEIIILNKPLTRKKVLQIIAG